MLRLSFLIVLHIFFCLKGGAQTMVRGADMAGLLDKLPPVAADNNEAYAQFFPKGKKSVYQQAEDMIMAQIDLLANQAPQKSRLLSMISGRYDDDQRKRVDFEKTTIVKDKELENKMKEANQNYFAELNLFTRAAGNVLDSFTKINVPAVLRSERQLQAYKRLLPPFIKTVKQVIADMNAYLSKKGFNAVLDNRQASHPNYIQLLEVRALLFDRIREVNTITGGASQASAMIVDMCKRFPDSCN